MRHWDLLGEATIPNSTRQLRLYRGKDHFSITIEGGHELMTSRQHGSEDALGRLPCQRLTNRESARVLIGGLGMGFTLAAALAELGPGASVIVAELIPEVVDWNRGPLGQCSGWPLNDPRCEVIVEDVANLIARSRRSFDVIALDVDNGPEGLTNHQNDQLYDTRGIETARDALVPGGILAYWSSGRDHAFRKRLRRSGLSVEEIPVRAHANRGARHIIWLARKLEKDVG